MGMGREIPSLSPHCHLITSGPCVQARGGVEQDQDLDRMVLEDSLSSGNLGFYDPKIPPAYLGAGNLQAVVLAAECSQKRLF